MPAEAIAEPIADKPIAPAATDTPPSKPAKPTEKAPTPEELEVAKNKFVEGFLQGPANMRKKPKADVPKPEEKPATDHIVAPTEKIDDKPEPEPEKKAEDKPKQPENEKPTVVVQKPKADDAPAADPDEDEQARIDATVARRMEEMGYQNREPNDQPIPEETGPDAHLIRVATTLEQLYPGKYDGSVQKIKDYRNAEAGYRSKWLRENPGEKFNPGDESHAEWYNENEPKFSEQDYKRAERTIERAEIAAEARQQVMAELEPELKQTRIERQMAKARPAIEKAVNESMVSVLSAVPDFEKAMDNGEGAYVLSPEREKSMQTANPVLYAMASEQSDKVIAIVTELEKMNHLGSAYPINERMPVSLPSGETIRPHAEIADTLSELESAISAAPPKERIFNGKSFITVAERGQRIAEVQRSNLSDQAKRAKLEAIRNGHWTVEASDIKERIIKRSRNRLEALAKKIPSSPPKPAAGTSRKSSETATADNPPKEPAKPASRGGSDTVSSSDVIDSPMPGKKADEDSANLFLKKMRGG